VVGNNPVDFIGERIEMSENQLPKPFSEIAVLKKYLHFALPTTKERLRARVASTMPELQGFYDEVGPHMDAILTYLKDFPPNEKDLAPDVLCLVRLGKAYMEASLSVEMFHAPDEPNVGTFENMELESF
jgi:hypothetical protein